MIPYIDMHCDTLYRGVQWGIDDFFQIEKAMLDGRRLVDAGAEAQFFAIFFPPVKVDSMAYLQWQGRAMDDET